jgi:tetratricopeptide (TPR) repeat protein
MAGLPRFGKARFEADEFYRKALEFYKKHNLSDAIQNINFALMLLPRHAEYLATRGFFYYEDGVLDRAEADFDEALRRNAFEVLANYGKGMLAYQAKDWRTALDHFMKAWAAEDTRAETHYYIALCHHRLFENEQAADWMRKAIVLYEKGNDKARQRDAERWLVEFEKLARKASS